MSGHGPGGGGVMLSQIHDKPSVSANVSKQKKDLAGVPMVNSNGGYAPGVNDSHSHFSQNDNKSHGQLYAQQQYNMKPRGANMNHQAMLQSP